MLVQSGDGLKVKKEEGFGKDTLRNSSLDEWGQEVPLTEVRHPQGEQRRVWGNGGLGHIQVEVPVGFSIKVLGCERNTGLKPLSRTGGPYSAMVLKQALVSTDIFEPIFHH